MSCQSFEAWNVDIWSVSICHQIDQAMPKNVSVTNGEWAAILELFGCQSAIQALTSEHYQLMRQWREPGNLPDCHFSFQFFQLGIPTDYTPMPLRRRLAVLLTEAVAVFSDLAVGQLQLKEAEGNFRIKFYKSQERFNRLPQTFARP